MLAARWLSSTGPSCMLGPELTSPSWAMNSCVDTTQPATQSLVPLMNLVKLWTTMSAPSRRGERIIGLKVLSTTRGTPLLWAMEASRGRSLTSSSGLVIDSVNRTRVRGVIASRTSCSLQMSTKRVVMPSRGNRFFSSA